MIVLYDLFTFNNKQEVFHLEIIRRILLGLVIIGAINWGLIGLFQFDLVAALFGGQSALLSRIIYTLVGISGVFCLFMLFEPFAENDDRSIQANDITYNTEFGEDPFSDENNKNK